MNLAPKNALVLFSGGQDSTTCLAWALEQFGRVETVGFAYGQRHATELEARPRVIERMRVASPAWAARLGPDHMLSLDVLWEIGGSALTDDIALTMGADGLPNTFVPGRNLMFLTAAAALGWRRGIYDLVGGMCETDYSGYPDCRADTIAAMEKALSLGLDRDFAVHTPLMRIDKAETWRLAERLGGTAFVELIVEETVTCYRGADKRNADLKHEWGYGCGDCPACILRAGGHRAFSGSARRMTYQVKEIFYTLQGEGARAGRAAVFLRFAGCNLWSGREEDRANAVCTFCDTDFVGTDGSGGGKFANAASLARAVAAQWPEGAHGRPYVVCTGGEPLLQLDAELIVALHGYGFEIAIETNGTVLPPTGIDWICVSPKAGAGLLLKHGDELEIDFSANRRRAGKIHRPRLQPFLPAADGWAQVRRKHRRRGTILPYPS